MTGQADDAVVRLVAGLRAALPCLLAVYHFGSTRDGVQAARSGADIDLAVLAPEPLDAVRLWDLAQRLAAEVGRDVDLVDLLGASTVFRHEILTTGERVWCADPVACDHLETAMLSMYLRFNEERAEIMADIRARGTVY